MHRQSRRPLWPLRKARHYGSGTRLANCVRQNMQAIDRYRAQMNRQRTVQDRIADLITRWSGSMAFVYLHIAWFGIWILANTGLLGTKSFDPFPFGLLTMIVSLEAIFLSTFVLVSQNRQAEWQCQFS
jgi:uncharacterized membrane protein